MSLTRYHEVVSLHNAAVSSDSQSTAVDLQQYTGIILFNLSTANTAGTNPTLAVKLQTGATSSTATTDVTGGAFTGATTGAALSTLRLDRRLFQRYVRLDFDIGGTNSPAYGVAVTASAPKVR